MEYLACPSCGSTYFLSSRHADRIVFHLGIDNLPIVVDQPTETTRTPDIDVSQLFCGACSCSGKIDQLLAAHI
jgi:hypothetical protein